MDSVHFSLNSAQNKQDVRDCRLCHIMSVACALKFIFKEATSNGSNAIKRAEKRLENGADI